ncbi:TVP38/TMEM64 family protein [Pelagibius litoralis]|uniref:TVP38/TMEM64 family membrane protein n=1 Tax=Pelagibius litoralis TaxID=374515 RepID=A0A967F1L2_9PROT|nr:TVP38/TMEM64 family protein [Pelagibius litoralis]NIA71275.1 TVP38/TMEM64 family protein [Pelagibius litoralis]
MTEPSQDSAKKGISFGRLVPLLILIAGLGAFFLLGWHKYVSFDVLRENRAYLLDLVARYGIVAGFGFIGLYALVAAFSIPGGAILTITAGFLFGPLFGTVYVVIGASLGACALFLAARYAFADLLRAKAGPAIQKMEAGFRENAFNYLLLLRLVPLFPFFVVNLVPAFLGVTLRTYFIATFFGIIPGSFVYALVGNGLGAIFDRGEVPDLGTIFQPQFLAPILGLAVLAIIPVIYKKMKDRKKN